MSDTTIHLQRERYRNAFAVFIIPLRPKQLKQTYRVARAGSIDPKFAYNSLLYNKYVKHNYLNVIDNIIFTTFFNQYYWGEGNRVHPKHLGYSHLRTLYIIIILAACRTASLAYILHRDTAQHTLGN